MLRVLLVTARTVVQARGWDHGYRGELDVRDVLLVTARLNGLSDNGPQSGEWVDFADGVRRRVSHVWPGDWHDDGVARVQTSDGGSWYLGNAGASFSGSLHPGVRADVLELTAELRDGSCWVFHHDHHVAYNGVDVLVPWRVWRADCPAPR